jgi:hypothetical protein
MKSHFNQPFDIDVYFTIKYFAQKHNKTITRRAKWDSQCKTWNSKKGIPCMTYFDVDANGYRTATGQYEVLNA